MSYRLLVVYVPATHAQAVRDAIAINKGGAMGNYDSCSFSVSGVMRFRPLGDANPHIGKLGEVAEVEEIKIESVVSEESLPNVLKAVRLAHPYEEPAIHLTEFIDYKRFLPAAAVVQESITKPREVVDVPSSSNSLTHPPISIVLEGLDGVGKSTVALKLAAMLNAKHSATPPQLMLPAREWFVKQDNHMRKAYYMVGNFIAGAEMQAEVSAGRSIVLDRYYASTIAYILGKKEPDTPLPEPGDEAYAWPEELYRPTCMFMLDLPEEARIARHRSRTSVKENEEERLLRENSHISDRIRQAYMHLGCQKIDLEEKDGVDAVVRKILDRINLQLGYNF